MRLVFLGGDFAGRLGRVEASGAVVAFPEGVTLDHFISSVPAVKVMEYVPPSQAVFLAPLAPQARIICIGLNFRTHAEEAGLPVPDKPSLFTRFASSLVGPDQPVILPVASSAFDFEGELAVVIGKGGRHIAEADVEAHILGYTIFADNSLRDWQNHSRQITPCKNFDSSGSICPWIVTKDEIPDRGALEIETFVNGQRRQHGFCNDLIFSVPYVISYVSQFMALKPGDIIAMGTPAGSAAGDKIPDWLKDGERIEIRISGIGSLKNHVTTETAAGETRITHD